MNPGSVELDLAPGALLAPALARVVGALGARAGLDVDRLTDAAMAAAAIAARLAVAPEEEPVRATVTALPGGLRIVVGPLAAGEPARLRDGGAAPGMGSVVDRLVDRVAIVPDGVGECLRLEIDRGPRGPGPASRDHDTGPARPVSP